MDEAEEFEFRRRAEAENASAGDSPPEKPLSWNPLKWDWKVSKSDITNTAKNLKMGVTGLAKQVYKGANDSVARTLLMPADATTALINFTTGRRDEPLGEMWQRGSDAEIAPPNNMVERLVNFGSGVAVGSKLPLPIPAAGTAPVSAAQKTADMAREAGYKLPPSSIPNAGRVAKAMEKMVGTKTINAAVSPGNKATTLENIAKEFDLPAGTQITPEVIDAVQSHAWESGYAPIEALGGQYKDLIDVIRKSRENVKKFYKDYARNATSEKLDMAQAAQAEASNAEGVLAGALKKSDTPELYDAYVKARQTIAKASDVERNLIESTGELKPSGLAREFGKGAPQSGAIEAAGRVSQAVPKAFNSAPSSLSMVDKAAGLGSVAGLAGTAFLHNPAYAKAGLGILAARLAQVGAKTGMTSALTSEWAQDAMSLLTPAEKRQVIAEAMMRSTPALENTN